MGQLLAKLAEPLQHCSGMAQIFSGQRKRKRSLEPNLSSDDLKCNDLQSPKKKKLLTTTQYIYQALFKEQKNSDIAVMVLGRVWNLHKVYLCQSPYFYSMFNGSWKESCQNFVHIKILDERITIDALDAVFGSMYSDEIDIDPKDVIPVLATATLFSIDGIIDKCAEVMIETINAETAISYYEASCQYGCVNVKKATFIWLETNLLCIYPKHLNLLRHINIELMTALVASHDLYVMQTEFSLYTLLRTWIYLRLHSDYDPENPHHLLHLQQQQQNPDEAGGSIESVSITPIICNTSSSVDVIHAYFLSRMDKHCPFLATGEGQEFVKPFQVLRTQYLTNHHMDLKIILSDNILPKEWLHSHVLSHWNAVLKIDHMPEEGPQNVDADMFFKNCMRCGRILLEPGYQKWRWTGFNFGLDLILIADSRVLSIRRHHRNEHERLLSLQTKRQFMIRASVTSINSQHQLIFTQKSEITSLCLEKNEEVTLMLMDTKLVHPLLISVNLLVVAPCNQSFKENVHTRKEDGNAIPISEIGANCERSTENMQSNATVNGLDSAICLVPTLPPVVSTQTTHRSVSVTSTASSLASSAASSMDFL